MDTLNSFKGYGKVDPQEEQAFKRKTRKRLIILIVSLVLLAALIVGVVVGTVAHKKNKNDSNTLPSASNSPEQSIKAICSVTNYPDSCYSSLTSMEGSNTTDPEKLFQISLQVAMNALEKIAVLPQELMKKTDDNATKQALGICQVVFDDAIDSLNDSISSMNVVGGDQKILSVTKIGDLRTWLSTTLTDQETCLDALAEANATIIEDVRRLIKDPNEFTSNGLAIGSKILTILSNFNIPIHRKLLESPNHVTKSGFPHWLRAADRRLLQAADPKPDVTVAADGSGDFKTIKEALAKVPVKSLTRFVIYVKSGTYTEQLSLSKSVWNVLIYGDGKTETIIQSAKNFVDGTQTFDTATFAVAGKNFMMKNIAVKNTAGAAKHQAVALRSGSDQSVFYGCLFDGFQDTLYAHSNRQFYRECDITGTIDFIFGNAAVVFQNCNIQPRQPLSNQFNTITAQGKKDVNQNTGISIQNCILSPLDALTAPTYLGRPWKEFSTTVIMQSTIGAFLNPQGWTPWVPTITPPSTIFYAEYLNTGPGAGVDQRVKWAKTTMTADQASKFTVKTFIDGAAWLPQTQVLFE